MTHMPLPTSIDIADGSQTPYKIYQTRSALTNETSMNRANIGSSFCCLACAFDTSHPFATDCRDRYLGFPGTFSYRRCQRCGLVQLHPVPESISSYYRNYPIHHQKSRFFDSLRRRIVGGGYARPPAPALKILDFGCGDGWYLDHLISAGHAAFGFEADTAHAHSLSEHLGTSIYADTDDLVAEHAGTLDLITMHFVLEHLPKPAEAFALVSQLLKPGGQWYFVIPNLASLEFRLFGTLWHGFDVPRHVSYLGEDHVHALAFKAGLQVRRAHAIGSATDFAGSASNIICGRYVPMAFFAALTLGILWSRILPGACRCYWLQKPVIGT